MLFETQVVIQLLTLDLCVCVTVTNRCVYICLCAQDALFSHFVIVYILHIHMYVHKYSFFHPMLPITRLLP